MLVQVLTAIMEHAWSPMASTIVTVVMDGEGHIVNGVSAGDIYIIYEWV